MKGFLKLEVDGSLKSEEVQITKIMQVKLQTKENPNKKKENSHEQDKVHRYEKKEAKQSMTEKVELCKEMVKQETLQ